MKRNLLLFLFILASAIGLAQDNIAQRLAQYNLSSKLGLSGYDPVSYFSRKPQKGSAAIAINYQGISYRFASVQNKEAFLKSPQVYEPQYGGWCAYAMGSDGSKVEVDPETYKIVNGKLYLFYHSFFNNTLKSWNKNETALKKSADANWKKYAVE